MEYTEIDGDLIKLTKEGKFDIIAHGANCQKMMGAGVAKQIREHFPPVYLVDKEDIREPISRLGDFTKYESCSGRIILNLYTQFYGGPNLNLDALKLCLSKVNYLYAGKHIGLPKIGCGIAGGDWEIVKEIIKTHLTSCKVTIVNYKK